jgi:type II secretory pathway component PulJ
LKIKQPIWKRLREISGFSLIEVLFAMLIFTTSLLLIFGMFPAAYRSAAHARYAMMAAEVAKQEMEYVKSLGWYQLTPNAPEITGRPPTTMKTTVNGEETVITFTSDIKPFNYINNSNGVPVVKAVRIQVTYNYGSTDKIGATLETLITKPE